jgi:glycosyltransferase EpsE
MEGVKKPRVSVVMPTHNRGALLSRAIESVRAQTFSDWELVVTDDASTDDTWQMLEKWAARDSRIKPRRNATNQYPDISKILNDGLARAEGEYIARLDDDDYWIDSAKLEKQVAYLDTHPECIIVGTGVVVVDSNNNERYRYLKPETDAAIRKSALLANPFTHSAVLYRKASALAEGGYERQYAEDWTLWLKMGKKGALYNIPEYSTGFLMAGQNKTLVHQRAHTKTLIGIVSRFRGDYPNFFRGYVINATALIFSYIPSFLRKALFPLAARVKRIL